jgi:thioredoxin
MIKKQFLLLALVGIIFLFGNCNAGNSKTASVNAPAVANDKSPIIHLTDATFKQKVFNYPGANDWKYLGTKPAIIDFYADWCGPCKRLAPILDEIAKEYAGKVIVYKVDTEAEKVLSGNLGIQSLPTLLFIPVNGKPQATMGLLPKETLVKAINEVLLVK